MMVATRSGRVFAHPSSQRTTAGKKTSRRASQSKKPTTDISGKLSTGEETEGILINCIGEPELLRFIGDFLPGSAVFIMSLVKKNGLCLKHASPPLREDREIVMSAITQNSEASIYMSEELHSDEEIWKACCRRDVHLINFNRNPEMRRLLARWIIDERLFPDEQFERQMLEIITQD